MKLITPVPLPTTDQKITYQSNLVLLGSCFAQNIGAKLDYYKFPLLQNPLGILYHPLAIENIIRRSLREDQYTASDLFEHQERWHSYDVHSVMSDADQTKVVSQLNDALICTQGAITTGSHIFITLGTAWVYRHTASDRIVANCHKVPNVHFQKELLSVEIIESSLQRIKALIQDVRPDTHIILTLSPVRHLRDGHVENQRSKSHLCTAIHQFLQYTEDTSYFPAYEIMMDELRDYRYYDRDMVHPNSLAIDYLWDKFARTWISPSADATMKEVDTIQRGLSHHPFSPDSHRHQQFLSKLKKQIKRLQDSHPHMGFADPRQM